MQTSDSFFNPKNKLLFDKAELLKHKFSDLVDLKNQLLKEEHTSEEEIDEIIKHYRLIRHDSNHKTGRLLVLIGAVFLLAGFAFTFLNLYANKPVHIPMYGLTTVGLLIMFIGLYYIFN